MGFECPNNRIATGAEEVLVNEPTYYFADNTFYQQIQRDGKTKYVIVDPPTGAKVPGVPEQTAVHEEDGETVYQYDETFYQKASADEGGQGYVVQAPPPEEKAGAEHHSGADGDHPGQPDLPAQ